MSISALNVSFDDDTFSVALSDGRSIHVPLVWFPRLLHATPGQREKFQLSSRGIHWEAIDEHVSLDAALAGRGDVTRSISPAASEPMLTRLRCRRVN